VDRSNGGGQIGDRAAVGALNANFLEDRRQQIEISPVPRESRSARPFRRGELP
jgi:hypothetical protein